MKDEIKIDGSTYYDFLDSPFLLKSSDGSIDRAIKIDTVNYEEKSIVLYGWLIDKNDGRFLIQNGEERLEYEISYSNRDDVFESFKSGLSDDDQRVVGFRLSLRESTIDYNDITALVCRFNEEVAIHCIITEVMDENESFQLSAYSKIDSNVDLLDAHIDKSGFIANNCIVIYGWVVCQAYWELLFINESGTHISLEKALKYQRPDIILSYADIYGRHTSNSGFVLHWPNITEKPKRIKMIALNRRDREYFLINSFKPNALPEDPAAYVNWSYDTIKFQDCIDEKLNAWEGDLILSLINKQNRYFSKIDKTPDVYSLGEVNENPKVSVIIPLYGRWDFIWNHLSLFSKDDDFLNQVELIYVVDDPRIISPILDDIENLYDIYKVPFKVCWGHRNRGFSGANNLGASIAQGKHLLFMNSDVFPTGINWLSNFIKIYENGTECGVLSSLLVTPNGSIQHAGMDFYYSDSWKVWLNRHPKAGLDKNTVENRPPFNMVEKNAVTGAFMLIEKPLFHDINGFDESYLIGDFEDSDLCLKVKMTGKKVGYTPYVELVHLERQSFPSTGSTSFMQFVMRFNAWQHTKRWGNVITKLKQKKAS